MKGTPQNTDFVFRQLACETLHTLEHYRVCFHQLGSQRVTHTKTLVVDVLVTEYLHVI